MSAPVFLPEFKVYPMAGGGYKSGYRLFDSQPFRFIPGCEPYPTAGRALEAAKEYVRVRLNPPIRGEITEARDVLGLAQWHEEKAAQRAAEQEQALGAIVVRGKQVKVERRQRA